MSHTTYPDLERFSQSVNISTENLVKAFEIEKTFHHRVLEEPSFAKRQELYRNVYRTVHTIYGKNSSPPGQGPNPKDKLANLFRKELANNSILEVGCGEGHFLESVARLIPHRELVGLDISINPYATNLPEIEFITSDIIQFNIGRRFDVVFSDQVLEHIAPADLKQHLGSVRNALNDGGTYVVNLPNRLFGPSDVTRIVDFSYTGRICAQGTHLNESTYNDLIPQLVAAGFDDFRTILPIPKLKFLLPNLRMKPDPLRVIENSPTAMKLLHAIRFRGSCIARFGICLICTKQ